MNPLYISVDLEFTDGERFLEGRIMQIGAVAQPFPDSPFGAVMPVSTRAYANDWVRKNLKPLLMKCWDLDNFTSRMPLVHTPTGKVNAAFMKNMMAFQQWVRGVQNLYFQTLNPELGSAPVDLDILDEKVPAVMVTYCGGYDFAYIAKGFSACGLGNPFHYEMLDISPLAMGKLGLPWGFKAADLEELLDMEEDPNKHDAVVDAKHQLKMFEALMDPELHEKVRLRLAHREEAENTIDRAEH